MAKKKKQSVVLKEFRIYDSKMNRNLLMFVPEDLSKEFETSKSIFRQVEMAWKITNFDTGAVLKDKVGPNESSKETAEEPAEVDQAVA